LLSGGYILAVDDNPYLALELSEDEELILYVYARWWNENVKEKRNVKRIKSFDEVLDSL